MHICNDSSYVLAVCAQLCLTLCHSTDYSPPDSSVHGILQARILESESESEVVKSCPTLCDPMDCNLPGSSVHGIFQARILEWVAISFSRGSSQPRGRTWVSSIASRRFTFLISFDTSVGKPVKSLKRCHSTHNNVTSF